MAGNSRSGRYRWPGTLGRGVRALDADLDGLEHLPEGGACLGGLLDVPLHAGLAVLHDGDADGNQLLLLLRQGSVAKRGLLERDEGLVDLGVELQQTSVTRLSLLGDR